MHTTLFRTIAIGGKKSNVASLHFYFTIMYLVYVGSGMPAKYNVKKLRV